MVGDPKQRPGKRLAGSNAVQSKALSSPLLLQFSRPSHFLI